jgi:putative transposase
MILTVQLQLDVDESQRQSILSLLEDCSSARNKINELASEAKVYRWLDINNLAYRTIKNQFGLPANLVQSLIRQVAVELTRSKGKKTVLFRDDAAIPLIGRYIKPKGDEISIRVRDGWISVPYLCGTTQRDVLNGKWREAKLQCRDGKLFLYIACEIADAETLQTTDFLGIDLGIVNIATDSSGESFSGEHIQDQRRMFAHRRRNLQRNGSRAAKRKLRSIRHRQARFQAHVNHVIAKRIVAKAIDAGSAIALEELTGIRNRVKVRRRQRAAIHNWGFHQLRLFIEYKAKRKGIPVLIVDPRNTSRTCPECGHVAKGNRPSQAVFCCQSCGVSGPADSIAARNIRARAFGDKPMVASESDKTYFGLPNMSIPKFFQEQERKS